MDANVPAEIKWTQLEAQMIKFLGQDVAQSQVAEVCGVSAGFVSQCMGRPEFAAEVMKLRAKRTVAQVDMNQLADSIQLTALQRLDKLVSVEHKIPNLLNIIDKMDKMSRKGQAPALSDTGATTVTIVLPPALQHYAVSVDTKNRVIEVGGTTMLPASSGQVEELAANLKGQRQGDEGTKERSDRQAGPLQLRDI